MKARTSFLKAELEKHGKLICAYCKRDDLQLLGKVKKATVDHIKPKSLGGAEFSHENFAVCCRGCNGKKGSELEENFISGKYLALKKKHQRLD
jgi:5-methylcytosine-specific restriction endonuclease McrA